MSFDSIVTVLNSIVCLIGVFSILLLSIGFLTLVAFLKRNKFQEHQKFKVVHMNEKIEKQKSSLLKKILSPGDLKNYLKSKKLEDKKKAETKKEGNKKPKLFVFDFHGDIQASEVQSFRDLVTNVLLVGSHEDEILLRIESMGGMVHCYGFAASQVERLKAFGFKRVTVSVDKVAASGGYMMAALGDRIIAAPFAIVGSIGVVASIPNVSRLLKKHDVDYLEMTAGEYKRTLTPFGEITEDKKEKFNKQLEETHVLFKDHIHKFRKNLDMNVVATGEYWYGTRALELCLVDELRTSDDEILRACETSEVYYFEMKKKKALKDLLKSVVNVSQDSLLEAKWPRMV